MKPAPIKDNISLEDFEKMAGEIPQGMLLDITPCNIILTCQTIKSERSFPWTAISNLTEY
jgi:hypothetical protein